MRTKSRLLISPSVPTSAAVESTNPEQVRDDPRDAKHRESLSFSDCSILCALAVLLAICCASSFGQSPQVNNLTVAIKAAGDLPIAGATCELVSMTSAPPDTSVELSDDEGMARFANALPGDYTLIVSKAGFYSLTSSIVINDRVDNEIQIVLSTAGTQEIAVAVPTSEIPATDEPGGDIASGILQRGSNTSDRNYRLDPSYKEVHMHHPRSANINVPSQASAQSAPPATSAQQETDRETFKDPTTRVFELVLPGEHLFGDWGGLRSKLEKSGITPRLILVTDLAGNARGGRSQGVTAPSSLELSLFFDLEKIAGLKGGSVFASFSHRWGDNLSAKHIGNTFSTQQIFGFQTYRLIDLSYQQKLFDDRVELRLGRFAAMDDFLVSPYNFGMMSNAFCGNPFGILLSAPGMSAYYGTWAALGKVKPTRRSYVMSGVYNGDPKMRDNKYHGVNFSMSGPLFSITEAGYQINGLPGDGQHLGNYKMGAWYDRSTLTDFESGVKKRGSWGYYGLFDQVLVPWGRPGSNRGFGVFGSVTVAPDSRIQQLPLYVTAGVSARGFFDTRPRDAVSLGVASGHFSEDLRRAERSGRPTGPAGRTPDRETIIELTYRFDLRKGAYFIQPDLQFINRQDGAAHLKNAVVLGGQFGINF